MRADFFYFPDVSGTGRISTDYYQNNYTVNTSKETIVCIYIFE